MARASKRTKTAAASRAFPQFKKAPSGITGFDEIIAAPTLIKSLPLPLRRLVGDFSDQHRVILGLDIKLDEEQGSA